MINALVIAIALAWGFLWALLLQWHPVGRWLAVRRTWLTVVIGVGVDLGLALFLVPFVMWLKVTGIVVASSVGIIGRSLFNEWKGAQETLARFEDGGRYGKSAEDGEQLAVVRRQGG